MNQYGKISIKPGSDAAKLITKLGSKSKSESLAAAESFAAFFGPVIQQVVDQAPVISNLYQQETYLEGTAPSLPLDLFYDVKDRNFITVWTQGIAGGLATTEVKGLDEMFFSTYRLDTAVSMQKKYAREARLNVVAATMNRMAQEILVKQEINGANILLKAVADAQYDSDENGVADTRQVIRATTADVFQLDDLNRLFTLMARTKPSWFGGTPVGGSQGLTHLVLSPEMIEQIRAISYNPSNTRGVPNSDESTALAAPDSVRNAVWNLAGTPNFFGVELVVANEFGVGKRYNKVFAKYAGSTQYGGSAFTQASQEIIVALNLAGTNPLVRLTEANGEGGTFEVAPDEFHLREDRIGFFGGLREGRAVLDSRGIGGIIV
jgi:hypothetical protein